VFCNVIEVTDYLVSTARCCCSFFTTIARQCTVPMVLEASGCVMVTEANYAYSVPSKKPINHFSNCLIPICVGDVRQNRGWRRFAKTRICRIRLLAYNENGLLRNLEILRTAVHRRKFPSAVPDVQVQEEAYLPDHCSQPLDYNQSRVQSVWCRSEDRISTEGPSS
jgi:hypothetical protein